MDKFVPYGVIAVLVLLGILIVQNLLPTETVAPAFPAEIQEIDPEEVDPEEDESSTGPLTFTVDEDGNVTGTLRFRAKMDRDQFDQPVFLDAIDRLRKSVGGEQPAAEPAPDRATDPGTVVPQSGSTSSGNWQRRVPQSTPTTKPRLQTPVQPRSTQPPSSSKRVVIYHHYPSSYVPAQR